VEAHHKRTEMCGWIERTAGIPTLLDIRRHAKYHATEVRYSTVSGEIPFTGL